jgi:hypothetical protein
MLFGEEFRAGLHDLLVWRRDVRRFKQEEPAVGAFERLVELACLAPSVGLSQPWRFVVVESRPRREAIRACFSRLQCRGAPTRDRRESGAICPIETCRARRRALSVRCFCGSNDRSRSRTRSAYHADDDRLFGRDGRSYSLARSKSRGHGFRFWTRRLWPRCWMFRRHGSSSDIFAGVPGRGRQRASAGARRVGDPPHSRFCSFHSLNSNGSIARAGRRTNSAPCGNCMRGVQDTAQKARGDPVTVRYRQILESDVAAMARVHRRACLIAYKFMNWSYTEVEVRD